MNWEEFKRKIADEYSNAVIDQDPETCEIIIRTGLMVNGDELVEIDFT